MDPQPIPLADLGAVHKEYAGEIEEAVLGVLRGGRYVLGAEVEAFEREIQQFLGSGPALAVSSGTDAILLALMAIGAGPGDEVITTPFTFFATAGTIARTGARPVFVDIDRNTYNIDPARAAAAVTPRTKAILPVHLFGRPAELDALGAIAGEHKLQIIEDCAQAIGTQYKGKSVGTRFAFGTWSLFPTKNLGAAGDAGFLTINDPQWYDLAKSLRTHGETQRYHHKYVGGNFRMDALQCAIVRVKLRYMSKENEARRRNARRYRELLAGAGLAEVLRIPGEPPDALHSYHQFTIAAPRRDALVEYLGKQKIGAGVYYRVPLHLQPCFEYLGCRRGSMPNAEAAAAAVVSLPIHGRLRDEDLARVCDAIRQFYQ